MLVREGVIVVILGIDYFGEKIFIFNSFICLCIFNVNLGDLCVFML